LCQKNPSRFAEEVVVAAEDKLGKDPKQSNNEEVARQVTGMNMATNNNNNKNKEKEGKKKGCPSCRLSTHRQATRKLCAMNRQTVQKRKQSEAFLYGTATCLV
jgi:hypothetical protein